MGNFDHGTTYMRVGGDDGETQRECERERERESCLVRPEGARNEGSTGSKRPENTRCTERLHHVIGETKLLCADSKVFLLLHYSSAQRLQIHKFMSLKYEPSSEPLHISAK